MMFALRSGTARGLAILGVLLVGLYVPASAGADVIISPTAGVINSGGPGFGSLGDTFDQSGLSAGFVSGVTDFDAYLGTNPEHTYIFAGFEWFSNLGSTSASVTYDLGSVTTINRLALWNEESSGIGRLDLFYSSDNITFLPLASNLVPTNHPATNADYGADVFAFTATAARYVRFDMSACPQANSGFDSCAIGEVAFAAGPATAAPEPAAVSLLALGLAGLIRRRRANR